MCTEEVSLTERTSQNGALFRILVFESIDEDVALSDTDPRRAPHVQRHTIIALRGEVGNLNGLNAVGTSTTAYYAVTSNDVECPQTLIVHIRRLECTVAGICHRHRHVLVDRRFGVDCVLRLTVEEVAA